MSQATLRQAFEFLIVHARDREQLQVCFFGGEPLLETEKIFVFADYCQAIRNRKDVALTMTTNGTLLNEDLATRLAERGIRYLLSLDGAAASNDRHRRGRDVGSVSGCLGSKMAMLKRYQPWQGARYTVCPDTAGQVCDGARSLHDLGINQIIIAAAHGAEWSDAAYGDYEESLVELAAWYHQRKRDDRALRITLYEHGDIDEYPTGRLQGRWGCGAGRSRVSVSPDGTLYGCSKLASLRGFSQGILPLGHVAEGFTAEHNRHMLNTQDEGDRLRCQACALVDDCAGNCFAENYAATGNIYTSGPQACRMTATLDRVRRRSWAMARAMGA